jgi:hypothetical protein
LDPDYWKRQGDLGGRTRSGNASDGPTSSTWCRSISSTHANGNNANGRSCSESSGAGCNAWRPADCCEYRCRTHISSCDGAKDLKTKKSFIKMSKTITQQFADAFDPKDQKHVSWLQKMLEIKLDPEKMVDLSKEMNTNPMNIKVAQVEALDWPHINFVLCAKYAKAVLCGEAIVPMLKSH